MSPKVLWRKLQKKKKRKEYRKCPRCGGRCEHRLGTDDDGTPRLFQQCEDYWTGKGFGYRKELFWTGRPG